MITGGAGFIGSNFVIEWLSSPAAESIINLDKLTYAGNLDGLKHLQNDVRHLFIHGDISDEVLITRLLSEYKPRAIINFAAETHVDRSICGPNKFIQTNIVGTFNLLECARKYWNSINDSLKDRFRFIHISTDEVYGTLSSNEPPFSEVNRFMPNSPYSASKAASDHLVRAWFHTYQLPVITTNCSNNYGPYQFPEKLVPLVILNALCGKSLPVYGDGQQIRDWLYVTDHCSAIRQVLANGGIGETYNIGGWNEKANLEVVNAICKILNEIKPRADKKSYSEQITFVEDRPGHDRHYAIDASKIERELGWRPAETFDTGICKTVQWYLDNPDWVQDVVTDSYRDWL